MAGKRFGRLTVVRELEERQDGRIVCECKCDCGNSIDVKKIYLTTGETRSCGCLKKELEEKHLRDGYDSKRIDGVATQLFKGRKPRKDSSIGFRGVSKYLTRVKKEERYRAWITVKGKRYYKSGFKTPEDAYYNGRLILEKEYLPKDDEK